MAGDELDDLYSVKPDGFTALRGKLAAAAKQRGDAAAAKRISVARKPTTAAWVVNRFVLRHKETKQRLGELGDRLRAAHAAMDGEHIQALSIEQRRLIDELVRGAFQTAEVTNPSAALRDDVTATLQAAIADLDVTAKLGRLCKAKRWSGFGAFDPDTPLADASPAAGKPNLREELADAERAQAEADATLSERQQELSEARRRLNAARQNLRKAERDLDAADKAYDEAKQTSRDAAAAVKDLKARLRSQRQ